MTFTFNSKATYLAYRADWTKRYLAHLSVVRAAKLGIREANRAYSGGGPLGAIHQAYRTLATRYAETNTLLSERWEASAEACRQMELKLA
jgi:hypothetical protein